MTHCVPFCVSWFDRRYTADILAEKGMTVDEERFNALIKIQKETARNARKDAGADAWKNSFSSITNRIPHFGGKCKR